MNFSNKYLQRLVTMALVLTGLAMVCGIVIIDAIQHPQRYMETAQAEAPVAAAPAAEVHQIVDGKDVETGFVAEGDWEIVKATCTACHSSKLVLQNRATEDGWRDMIYWMQETQNLWDLGENEDKIVAYLAKFLGPEEQGRRAPLVVNEWYMIE